MIETQFEEVWAALSDAELSRFLALAPLIKSGEQKPSVGARTADPYASLPDIRPHLHLLSMETVRLLSQWRLRGTDLFGVYDKLGTVELSEIDLNRLDDYFAWVRGYRDEYRDIAYTALQALKRDAPELATDLSQFVRAGAKPFRGAQGDVRASE